MVTGYFGLAVIWFNFNSYTQRPLSIIVWSVYSVIGLVLFVTLLVYTGEFQESMLKQNGVSVKGVVVAENQSRHRSSTFYSITVGYTYNNKKYYQDFSNNIDMYKVKDTIIIICSSIDPQMAKVAVVNGDK
ncbi:MAG: DUF3592 domain-containing protein [Mucilaginibacter sp.]